MNEHKLKTPRGNVYYWISDNYNKNKETIFFLPGLTADHTMFDDQMEFFEERYNIIVWDAPCHGKSRPYQGISYKDTSEVILKILHTHEIENIIAVGQSLGGYHAQAFVLRYPEKVKAFIGIGTTPYGESYYSKSDKFWLRQMEWMSKCYPFSSLRKAMAKAASYSVAGYQNMMSMISPYGKNEFCHLMQMGYDAFLEDNQDFEISCPVLITYGDHDRVGKVRKYCEMWKKKTNYPVVIIENAGHNSNVDNPRQVNEVIQGFLDELQI